MDDSSRRDPVAATGAPALARDGAASAQAGQEVEARSPRQDAAATERAPADEALRLSERRFRALFEQAPLGLILFAPDGRLLEANQAMLDLFGLTPQQQEAVGYNVLADEHMAAAGLMDDIRRAFAGTATRLPPLHFTPRVHVTPPGTQPRWERGYLYPVKGEDGTVREVVAMVEDITERKLAEDNLRETEARYRSVFDATSDGLIITDLAGSIVEANPAVCRMHGYTYEDFIRLSPRQFIHPDHHDRFAHGLQAIAADGAFQAQVQHIRKDGAAFPVEVSGTTFTYCGGPHILVIVRDITAQVHAYALLEQRVAERTHELSTLLAVSHNVAATLELEPLLSLILDHLKASVDYSGAAIQTLAGDELTVLDYRGPLPRGQMVGFQTRLARGGPEHAVIQRREPLILDHAGGDTALDRAYRAASDGALPPTGVIRSWLGVPLLLKERVLGMVTLTHQEPYNYTPHHAALALAIANQAAVAMENARLYAQAQEGAAREERARLARELHDAVTQTIFSASVIAEVLPGLWERDPAMGRQRLEDVRQLTRGALAEMRTLLLELRPAALIDTKLGDLLRQLVEALLGRKRLPVVLTVDGERSLPPEVQVALYRVAQEALNNVARHARATQVEVRLRSHARGVELRIGDDGRGFDPGRVAADHFGLRIMHERAEHSGITLTVKSRPGRGTQVRAVWRDLHAKGG